MPQLMPLFWVFSVFMVFMMLMMLIDVYCYKWLHFNICECCKYKLMESNMIVMW